MPERDFQNGAAASPCWRDAVCSAAGGGPWRVYRAGNRGSETEVPAAAAPRKIGALIAILDKGTGTKLRCAAANA